MLGHHPEPLLALKHPCFLGLELSHIRKDYKIQVCFMVSYPADTGIDVPSFPVFPDDPHLESRGFTWMCFKILYLQVYPVMALRCNDLH